MYVFGKNKPVLYPVYKSKIYQMNLFKLDLTNRILGLDILRALAIIFVLDTHGKKFLVPYIDNKTLSFFTLDGVTIFFVLSGFLIGRILVNIYFKKDALSWGDLKTFWIRRWFRTLPPYFIVLILLLIWEKHDVGFQDNINYWEYFLFIQNLFTPNPPRFFIVAWSLSVEEWFYMSFPLMLFIGVKIFGFRSHKAFLFLVSSFILMALAYRTYICVEHLSNDIPIQKIYGSYLRKVVISRVDSMMIGVLAAYIYTFYASFWERNKMKFFGIGILFLIVFKTYYLSRPLLSADTYRFIHGVFSFSWISLATAFMLPILNSIKSGKGIGVKIITVISIVSYSLYLVHYTIRVYLINNYPADSLSTAILYYLIYIVISIFIAVVSYQCIERPFLLWRDRLSKKQMI